jgi:hypothetical protein
MPLNRVLALLVGSVCSECTICVQTTRATKQGWCGKGNLVCVYSEQLSTRSTQVSFGSAHDRIPVASTSVSCYSVRIGVEMAKEALRDNTCAANRETTPGQFRSFRTSKL